MDVSKNRTTKSKQFSKLRRNAELLKASRPSSRQHDLSAERFYNLLQELEVHQIELEMQNEELINARVEIENSRRKYYELYDFAPVGYCICDAGSNDAEICEINLTGAALLGIEKTVVQGKKLTEFICSESQDTFYFHHRTVFETGVKQTCNLKLKKRDGTVFWARLESCTCEDNKIGSHQHARIRSALVDITERKQAEDALQKAHDEMEKRVEERTAALRERTEELEVLSRKLTDMNAALRVVLESCDQDKKDLGLNIQHNLEKLVMPGIEKLKTGRLDRYQIAGLEVLETNLKAILSPFARNMGTGLTKLSPTELTVANYLQAGKQSKEIAGLMGLSWQSVETYRKHIRKKLGLTNSHRNLRSYLLSLR